MTTERRISSFWKSASGIAGGLGILTAAILGIVQLIDSRIDARLKNSQLRDDIIKEVNKYLVFDGRGIVTNDPNRIYDEWIDTITVAKLKEAEAYGTDNSAAVTIKFKKHMEIEPFLFAYGDATKTIGVRVSNLEWKFYQINVITAGPDAPKKDSPEARFLLQIFR